MRLTTMHSVILMLLLVFAFDNVDGDEPGQTARDVDNRNFMSILRSEGKPVHFLRAIKKRDCTGQACTTGDNCPSECVCNEHHFCTGKCCYFLHA
uniref:Conotoxin Im026 n=1 Tax=Conus imperialis TaxID=35631 RepID=CXQ_CONIM|nr:RecName: Full=Conotoxin Im026; AltName: Full=Conopeptide im026; Flags: Precursor [Conus imperialis]AME17684.1 conopeptide im026 [Conus imperialis]